MRTTLRITLAALVGPLVAAAGLACDDLNKPVQSVPRAAPRHTCFSDVECPGQKCLKSGSEIEGICSGPPAWDAGAVQGPAPSGAPTSSAPDAPQPSPNDIHL